MYIRLGDREIKVGPRSRLAASTAIVLLVHFFVFWGIASMRDVAYNLPDHEDPAPPLEVEVYDIHEPPPTPVPVIKVEPRPVETPPEPKPTPQPQQQQQQAAAPPPVPQPVPEPPAPQMAIKAQAVPQLNLQRDQARQLTQTQLADSQNDVPLVDMPSHNIKKRKDEEAGLQKPTSDVQSLNALNLHQATDAPPALAAAVAPSGLPAPGNPASGGPAGGGTPSAGGGAMAGLKNGQGIVGKDMNGRGSLTQAMQNHDYCNQAVVKGKSPPPNCNMTGLSGQTNLGLIDRPDLKKAAAQRDANLKYKTGTGNSDYWNRVAGSPSTGIQPNFRPDDGPQKGAYTDPKDQRVMAGGSTDPKSGN